MMTECRLQTIAHWCPEGRVVGGTYTCTYYVVHVCITWSTNYDCSVTLSVRVQYMRIQCTCMIMWSYLLM